jgi:RNA polymerase sigma factor (sigma-70 family)
MEAKTKNQNQVHMSDNEAIIDRLNRECVPAVREYLRKRGWTEDKCKEVIAEGILRLLNDQHKNPQKKINNLSAYFFSIIRHIILEEVRKKGKETMLKKYLRYQINNQHDNSDIFRKIIKEKQILWIYEVLLREPQATRDIIDLYFHEKLSSVAIGKQLNISDTAVRQKIHRFIQKLRHNVQISMESFDPTDEF